VSIVLMTDGENTAGRSLDDFRASYEALDDDVRAVPTFTVLFGDSNVEEMTAVADLTGGRVFDAREGDLSRAFQEIRGYQ
jgi:Ca-activated chloride channel family protein